MPVIYDVIITGKIIPGREMEHVLPALARLFKLESDKAAHLLQGRARRLRSGIDEAEARRYIQALFKAGAETHVICRDSVSGERIPSPLDAKPAVHSPAQAAAPAQAVDAGDPEKAIPEPAAATCDYSSPSHRTTEQLPAAAEAVSASPDDAQATSASAAPAPSEGAEPSDDDANAAETACGQESDSGEAKEPVMTTPLPAATIADEPGAVPPDSAEATVGSETGEGDAVEGSDGRRCHSDETAKRLADVSAPPGESMAVDDEAGAPVPATEESAVADEAADPGAWSRDTPLQLVSTAQTPAEPEALSDDALAEPAGDPADQVASDTEPFIGDPNLPGETDMEADVAVDDVATVAAGEPATPGRTRASATGKWRAEPTSARKLAQLAVIAITLLLPLCYLGIIALLGYGTWSHATDNLQWFNASDDMVTKYLLMAAYGLLLLAGPVLILLMLRPLASLLRADQQAQCALKLQEQPRLQTIISNIATFTGAPMPAEVKIDGEMKVRTTARGGLRGMFGNDFTLHIGLPVLTGMAANHMAALIGHEFAHFPHRLGRACHLVVTSMHNGYQRATDRRDRLDAWVARHRESRQSVVRRVFAAMGAGLATGRGVLRLLHRISVLVTRHLYGEADINADLCASTLAGAEVFRDTFGRLEELSLAQAKVDAEVEYMAQDGKYPDDLQPLMFRYLKTLSEEEKGQAEGALLMMRDNPWDIHRALAKRIATAMRCDARPVFSKDFPAWKLLDSYDAICRDYTLQYYRGVFGASFSSEQTVSAKEANRLLTERNAGNKALDDYLPNLYREARHVVPAKINGGKVGISLFKGKLHDIIVALREQLPVYEQAEGRLSVLAKQLAEANAAGVMSRVGVDFPASALGLPGKSSKAITEFRQDCEEKYQDLQDKLEKIEYLISCRMGLAIELQRRLGEEQKIQEMDLYARVLADLNQTLGEMTKLGADALAVRELSARVQSDDQAAGAMVKTRMDKCATHYRKILMLLKDTPYPFEHGEGIGTVAKYLRKHVGSPEQLTANPENPGKAWQSIGEILGNLNRRMMQVIATRAMSIEKRLGLESVRLQLGAAAEDGAEAPELAGDADNEPQRSSNAA